MPATPNRSSTVKPKHHWLRYSLRTLFFLVTVLCVALALWVVPAERQRRAVAGIREAGGEVGYDFEENGKDAPRFAWVADLFGVDYVARPESVELYRQGSLHSRRDSNLIYYSNGSHWRTPTDIDAPIRHASRLTSLRSVYLWGIPVSDNHLSLFTGHTECRELYLNFTKVTDTGLAHITNMRQLDTLWLSSTGIGDAGLARLRNHATLRTLGLNYTRITDKGLRYLADLPNLHTLSICNTRITDVGLVELESCKGLAELALDGTAITVDGVVRFRAVRPDCVLRIHTARGR